MPNWREEYIHRLTESVESQKARCSSALASITRKMGFEYCSFGGRDPLLGTAPQEYW